MRTGSHSKVGLLRESAPFPVPGGPIIYGVNAYTSLLLCSCGPLYNRGLDQGGQPCLWVLAIVEVIS